MLILNHCQTFNDQLIEMMMSCSQEMKISCEIAGCGVSLNYKFTAREETISLENASKMHSLRPRFRP